MGDGDEEALAGLGGRRVLLGVRLGGWLKVEIGSLKSHLQMQSEVRDRTQALGAQPLLNSQGP